MRISFARAGVAAACALLAATISLTSGVAHANAADTGALSTGTFTNDTGQLDYLTYVPASYQPGTSVPLVVALHGCTQTAEKFRALSQLDALADKRNFIVVYPEQPTSSNRMGCWNWFNATHAKRDSGEAALIAGITRTVQQAYSIDTKRTFVMGLSAGGAMTSVMGVTYPDIFAAVGVGSGCEYTAGAACAGYKSDDPELAGKRAYDAMGKYARVMPFIVFTGDQDKIVPPVNADQLVRAQQVTSDFADDGNKNGSIPKQVAKTSTGRADGGRQYTSRFYSDGKGHELGQYWTVHGMAHAWSGGDATQQYADATGPDESAIMYDFFLKHPLGEPGPALDGGGSGWPSIPGFPSTPTTPQQPTWPTWPTTGTGVPQLPSLPSFPQIPGLPQLPGWPKPTNG